MLCPDSTAGLRHFGVGVTFLLRDPWYWPAGLDAHEGEIICQRLRAHGVDVRVGEQIAGADYDARGRIGGVTLASGAHLPCQLAGVCVGDAVVMRCNERTPSTLDTDAVKRIARKQIARACTGRASRTADYIIGRSVRNKNAAAPVGKSGSSRSVCTYVIALNRTPGCARSADNYAVTCTVRLKKTT